MGLPLAMRAVEAGFNVVGFDTDAERIKRLCADDSYVEDVASEVVARANASGRYEPTTEPKKCAGFDFAVIDVPTPLDDGVPNLSYVTSAAEMLSRYLRPGATVIVESTTYPGTTEELVGPILENGSGLAAGSDFHLGYSPERIDPGNANWRFENIPKVVSGVDEASLEAVKGFFDRLVETHRDGVRHPRGRAHEAAREHLPAREHRAGQRAGDVRRRAGHRRLGGDRRGLDQALRLHALHARPRGGRALPADRPELPVVEGAPDPRPALQVRRARERHQRAHARLCRAAGSCSP